MHSRAVALAVLVSAGYVVVGRAIGSPLVSAVQATRVLDAAQRATGFSRLAGSMGAIHSGSSVTGSSFR
jgi:hypothetical protein